MIISGSSADVGSSNSMQIGIHRQRARDRHALLLAAGQLAGKLVLLRVEADAVEDLSPRVDASSLRAVQHLDLRQREVLA